MGDSFFAVFSCSRIEWCIEICAILYDGPNASLFLLRYEFSIPNSEYRILNSEFRISKRNVVYRNFVFGDATSGSVHRVGPFDLKLEQFKQ